MPSQTPDFTAFHQSVTEELYSVKDRIRNLVCHWPTDGEHKEVALRSVLRRHLPQSVIVGRGFVVSKTESSTQVDILVVDARRPTLFRDGDLLIVTPDTVRGVIEVKTKIDSQSIMSEVLIKLAKVKEMCQNGNRRNPVWAGLFIFDSNSTSSSQRILCGIANANSQIHQPINCISAGKHTFVRYWPKGEIVQGIEPGPVWHAYDLDGVAPSYFMGNLIDSVGSVDNSTAGFAWFPVIGGKEQYRTHYLPLSATEPLRF